MNGERREGQIDLAPELEKARQAFANATGANPQEVKVAMVETSNGIRYEPRLTTTTAAIPSGR